MQNSRNDAAIHCVAVAPDELLEEPEIINTGTIECSPGREL